MSRDVTFYLQMPKQTCSLEFLIENNVFCVRRDCPVAMSGFIAANEALLWLGN